MSEVDIDDVERAIQAHPDPVVTTGDLADDLGCSSRHVLNILRSLERVDIVESKQIGARAVAWWHTDRMKPPLSHERMTNEQQTNDDSITNEESSHEGTSNEQPDEIEQAVENAAERWNDAPERIEQRKEAARAALAAVRDRPMSKSEIIEEIYPDYPVEGQSERTWWRKNLAEGSSAPLKNLAEYSNSTKQWEWNGE